MLAHHYAIQPAALLMVPLGIAATARDDDAEPCLGQPGAAPDVTPEAVALRVTLRQLMAHAVATAERMAAAKGSHG